MATEIAMLHDISKCTACRACMVACKQWKDLPADLTPFEGEFQSHAGLSTTTFNLIKMYESYENNEFRWDFLKFQCMHCGDPACAKACPEDALFKLENGVVAFDESKCVGCSYCASYCPFGVPKIDQERNKSTKCDLCNDRIEAGMVPSCAQTCTADAIVFGTREEMVKEAYERLEFVKKKFPNAQLYGVDQNDGVKGTSMMYVLTDKPSKFGLPDEPKVSKSLVVWKDWVHPTGKLLLGATFGAVVVSAISKKVLGKKVHAQHEADVQVEERPHN